MAVENPNLKKSLEVLAYMVVGGLLGLIAEGFIEIFGHKEYAVGVILGFTALGLYAALKRSENLPTKK